MAAAHRLHELAPDMEVLLFEAAPRLGGVLETVRQDGFLIERGADNFITNVPWGIDLCRRVGAQAVSSVVTAIIIPDIVVKTQPTNVNECVGGLDQMMVAISGGSGLISYQWQSSTTGAEPWANAVGTGSTTNTFTPPSATPGTTYYRVLVNASNSDCAQAVSSVVTAIIIPDILVTTQPTNVNECVGGLDQMTVCDQRRFRNH